MYPQIAAKQHPEEQRDAICPIDYAVSRKNQQSGKAQKQPGNFAGGICTIDGRPEEERYGLESHCRSSTTKIGLPYESQ